MSAIAYWNGRYSSTASNLAYCNKGAFGTMATVDSPVPVANGGTGATAAAAARTNLEVPKAGGFASAWYVTCAGTTHEKTITAGAQNGHTFSLINGTLITLYLSKSPDTTDTSAVTFNINELGAKAVKYWNWSTGKSSVLPNHSLKAGMYTFVYNAAWFLVARSHVDLLQ